MFVLLVEPKCHPSVCARLLVTFLNGPIGARTLASYYFLEPYVQRAFQLDRDLSQNQDGRGEGFSLQAGRVEEGALMEK